MLPSILNQLGADMTNLRRLAEALPNQCVDGKVPHTIREDDDDDAEVPELVNIFDEASKNEAK